MVERIIYLTSVSGKLIVIRKIKTKKNTLRWITVGFSIWNFEIDVKEKWREISWY
jgi:hypothetical protein